MNNNDNDISNHIFIVHHKMHLFFKQRVFPKTANDLTPHKFMMLRAVFQLERANLKQIAKKSKVTSSSACVMINQLVNDGLVLREIDEKDRRNTYFSLTPLGQNVLKKERTVKSEAIKQSVAHLSEQELKRLDDALKVIDEFINVNIEQKDSQNT